MNSADALLKTLIANGLEVVFANPGTSETVSYTHLTLPTILLV